ncbi:hypothetical protein GCM10011492_23160 [Flexivirga endophytica]|uniref:ADP/GDP-polyphosphate phosphotransferase n=1 Tax=Flexivirga endophytica TaxID=1849103 RepID=A0A916WTP5_9MICO|nr:hypothetical protein GCM10011492_23160 [Flexivirga endophytica]GHB52821.1 hypothetical protein GCM10008112_22440 [Flexivirga endophytica]
MDETETAAEVTVDEHDVVALPSTSIELPAARDDAWRSGFPYDARMSRKEYDRIKRTLQIEMLKMQAWVKDTGQQVVIAFEGRDAAGKGGAIKRFTEHLNPRGASVVALEKPTEREQSEWYFQRYVAHLPAAGEIVFFDRSWYNRAGVERVMGYCTNDEYDEFMRSCPQIEQMWVNSGIRLIKLWFSVGRHEQITRFERRATDPVKQWKLSPTDLASLDKWNAYPRQGSDVRAHRHRVGALDGHQVQRQEARPARGDAPRARHDALPGQGPSRHRLPGP